jgi:hypothetical protein
MTIHMPATQVDLAACAAGVTTVTQWALARVQVRLGYSLAIRDESGGALAVGGYVYRDDETCDAWFMAAPAAGRRLLAIVRLIRLTGIPGPYRSAIAFVTTPEGRRLVRAIGFSYAAERPDGMEVWRWERS